MQPNISFNIYYFGYYKNLCLYISKYRKLSLYNVLFHFYYLLSLKNVFSVLLLFTLYVCQFLCLNHEVRLTIYFRGEPKGKEDKKWERVEGNLIVLGQGNPPPPALVFYPGLMAVLFSVSSRYLGSERFTDIEIGMNCLSHASQLSEVNGNKCIPTFLNQAPF